MDVSEILCDYGNYSVKTIEKQERRRTLDIYLETKGNKVKCSSCNKEIQYVREKYERTVRDLPMGEYIIVKLHYWVKIFECLGCRRRQTEKLSLVGNSQFATERFKLYVGKMATMIAPGQLARELYLDDNTIYRYEDYFLKKSFHK
jgi:transposase